jgi:dihydroorotate dehydrogenase
MYKLLLKPFLFLFSPEKAHHLALSMFRTVRAIPGLGWIFQRAYTHSHPGLEREVMGLTFRNPVGLAAGFDKDAKYFRLMENLGFGFVEVGTVTPRPQAGNPKPRLFRLPADRALINRMGFNNGGAAAAADRLRSRKPGLIIGGNIGKNKDTPNDEALNDYLLCFDALHPVVDYFAVNVSSPNTPGLRALQEKEPLKAILTALSDRNIATGTPRPILLKIAPDLTNEQLDDIVEIVTETGIAGVIATNTTIGRDGLKTPATEVERIGAGGLSGAPVRQRSTEVVRYLAQKSAKRFVIIGAGGILTAADAREKLDAGADLVQVYSGLVYEGPAMVKRILQGI